MTGFALAAGFGVSASAVTCGLTEESRQDRKAAGPHEVALRHVPLFATPAAVAPVLARRLEACAATEARRLEAMEEDAERWDGLS